jgi:hypothetical protein
MYTKTKVNAPTPTATTTQTSQVVYIPKSPSTMVGSMGMVPPPPGAQEMKGFSPDTAVITVPGVGDVIYIYPTPHTSSDSGLRPRDPPSRGNAAASIQLLSAARGVDPAAAQLPQRSHPIIIYRGSSYVPSASQRYLIHQDTRQRFGWDEVYNKWMFPLFSIPDVTFTLSSNSPLAVLRSLIDISIPNPAFNSTILYPNHQAFDLPVVLTMASFVNSSYFTRRTQSIKLGFLAHRLLNTNNSLMMDVGMLEAMRTPDDWEGASSLLRDVLLRGQYTVVSGPSSHISGPIVYGIYRNWDTLLQAPPSISTRARSYSSLMLEESLGETLDKEEPMFYHYGDQSGSRTVLPARVRIISKGKPIHEKISTHADDKKTDYENLIKSVVAFISRGFIAESVDGTLTYSSPLLSSLNTSFTVQTPFCPSRVFILWDCQGIRSVFSMHMEYPDARNRAELSMTLALDRGVTVYPIHDLTVPDHLNEYVEQVFFTRLADEGISVPAQSTQITSNLINMNTWVGIPSSVCPEWRSRLRYCDIPVNPDPDTVYAALKLLYSMVRGNIKGGFDVFYSFFQGGIVTDFENRMFIGSEGPPSPYTVHPAILLARVLIASNLMSTPTVMGNHVFGPPIARLVASTMFSPPCYVVDGDSDHLRNVWFTPSVTQLLAWSGKWHFGDKKKAIYDPSTPDDCHMSPLEVSSINGSYVGLVQSFPSIYKIRDALDFFDFITFGEDESTGRASGVPGNVSFIGDCAVLDHDLLTEGISIVRGRVGTFPNPSVMTVTPFAAYLFVAMPSPGSGVRVGIFSSSPRASSVSGLTKRVTIDGNLILGWARRVTNYFSHTSTVSLSDALELSLKHSTG